jgi:hypothetical protein
LWITNEGHFVILVTAGIQPERAHKGNAPEGDGLSKLALGLRLQPQLDQSEDGLRAIAQSAVIPHLQEQLLHVADPQLPARQMLLQ